MYRQLILAAAVATAVVLPMTGASASETLPEGDYVLSIEDNVVVVTVFDDGSAEYAASAGWSVSFQYDRDGRVLDEFDVVQPDGDRFSVEIDVDDETGYYDYEVDGQSFDEPSADEASIDEASASESETEAEVEVEATESETEAPGQHGRDNARENGGNANGYGAEDVPVEERGKPDKGDEESADVESTDEESADEAEEFEAEDDESGDDGADSDDSESGDDAKADSDKPSKVDGKGSGRR